MRFLLPLTLAGLALASPAHASFAERYPERAAATCEGHGQTARWAALKRLSGVPMTVPMREALAIPEPTARRNAFVLVREAYGEHGPLTTHGDNPHERRVQEKWNAEWVASFHQKIVDRCWANMLRD